MPEESLPQFFSPNLAVAEARFVESVERAGGWRASHAIAPRGPQGEELRIVVAGLGDSAAGKVVVVSSGLHGAEGFFGSALQTAWLSQAQRPDLPAGTRLLFLHALNPYGFAWRRRWNENNVDLNRNFLLAGEEFRGSPPLYARLESFLNPRSLPSRRELFFLKALVPLARYGSAALARAIPVGQYDFPQGLFFGGAAPEETQHCIEKHYEAWLGEAHEILHLDLHTGLGRFGTYQLLIDSPPADPRAARLADRFGPESVSPNRLAEGPGRSGVVYSSRGTWEWWLLARFAERDYQFATAEFGTYSGVRVIAALRAENRAYHFGAKLDPAYEWTREAVVEAFAPRSPAWREGVLRQGIALIDRALATPT